MDNIVCKDCGHIITTREAALSGKCLICGGVYTIKPLKTKTEPMSNVPCSEGLEGIEAKMRELSDQFEGFCCSESDDFTRGQFDGKSLAYEDCAEILSKYLRKADQ